MTVPATCDLSDRFGDDARLLPPLFRDFGKRKIFKGIAVTIKCFEDNSRIKEALATPGQGKVLVVDGGGSTRCALLGDMIAKDAVANGWEAIIILGSVRDTCVLQTLDIVINALCPVPRKSTRRGEGSLNIDVDIASVSVSPGDVVVGDADGVIVLKKDQATQADL
ncbi:MAG: ribonuclease E activity regulator RraA [Hyphomicrobium sp.]|uniref:ribonuclease E activity regulator RraA n=1 Tax=Hyphomicrobium sp. TaxID=82 RepID=UPI003568B77E